MEKRGNIFSELRDNITALEGLKTHLSIIIFVDCHNNSLNNPYMLTWRIVNNIDARRDILIEKQLVFIDATQKNKGDGYMREWPLDTNCTPSVIKNLKEKGLLNDIDDAFLEHFRIFN